MQVRATLPSAGAILCERECVRRHHKHLLRGAPVWVHAPGPLPCGTGQVGEGGEAGGGPAADAQSGLPGFLLVII
jgi:hypothetical protein